MVEVPLSWAMLVAAIIRIFVGEDDLSHQPLDEPLPPEVADGKEPLYVIGAMAGG